MFHLGRFHIVSVVKFFFFYVLPPLLLHARSLGGCFATAAWSFAKETIAFCLVHAQL
jgi:hypothetical protein